MKLANTQKLRFWLLILSCLCSIQYTCANTNARTHTASLDSLLKHLFERAEYNDKVVRHFESDLYTKGRIHRHRSNILIKTVPQINQFEHGVDEYLGETLNQLNYTAPYFYDRKVVAVSGTFPNMQQEANMVMDFFNLRIYNETMIDDHFLSPFVPKNRRFYRYQLDSIKGTRAYLTYHPRNYNTQLLAGCFELDIPSNTVRRTTLQGKYEFMTFKMEVLMGHAGMAIYLPEQFNLDFEFNYVWNKYSGHYMVAQRYHRIESSYERQKVAKNPYDLTERYFPLSTDTTGYLQDPAYVAQYRFLPLTRSEQQLYSRHAQRIDSLHQRWAPASRSRTFWNKLGDAMIAEHGLHVPKVGTLEISPILHPTMLQYSKTNGVTYRTDFGYTFRSHSGRYLRLAPFIGYNFKFKQLYYRFLGTYRYWPRRSAQLELEFGNGRHVHTDKVLEEIAQHYPGQEGLNLDKLHLEYFDDRYLRLNHQIELVNGLHLMVGLNIHSKRPDQKPEVQLDDPEVKSHYTTFAPRVRVEYTPKQYYYWDRGIKKKVYSPYPTFSLDWENGIKGVLGSNSRFQRWELEMYYQWKPDVFKQISYRIGAGILNRQEKTYFTDYINFQHSHLPEGWSDEQAGTFQLLEGKHYDATERYIRGHVVYESPMLAITRLNGVAHFIKAERLYLSGLYTPLLKPYIEIGYGFTTHVFDLGFFASAMENKFNEVGVKFAFELFRH